MKQRRPFIVERRVLPVRLDQIYAAHPDTIAELRDTADKLQNVPRDWLESREDMCHGLRRVAGRLRQIAERIEVLGPPEPSRIARPPAATKPRSRCPIRRPSEGQIEMVL